MMQIEEQLHLEQVAAEEAAQKLGVPLIAINNEQGDSARFELAELFEKYLDE